MKNPKSTRKESLFLNGQQKCLSEREKTHCQSNMKSCSCVAMWWFRRVLLLGRYKVSGPDGSNYWVSHETHVGGSDADDA